jgi:hypothetical protein
MIISFSFTLRIMPPEEGLLEFYMKMLYKSIYAAREHHKVILYTDELTLPHLSHIHVEKRIVDTTGFLFLDDLKVHLLSIISSDEILIDIDVFLHKPLELPNDFDLYIDYMDLSYEWYYTQPYEYFVSKGIRTAFPNYFDNIIDQSGNIGLLYFKNDELKKHYIQLYHKVRSWILGLSEGYEHSAVFLGQYLLGVVLHRMDYKICYLKLTNNDYTHYAGQQKFKNNVIDNIPIEYPPKKLI